MGEECPKLEDCPIFEKYSSDASRKIWVKSYCRDIYEKCERYQKMQRGEDVPITMLPSGEHAEHLKK